MATTPEEITGRLIAVLYHKGILKTEDTEYIFGHVSENDYIGTDTEEE